MTEAQDLPPWAARLRAERLARDWSVPTAVRALRAHSDTELTDQANLVRTWRRWESGEVQRCDDFYKSLIAKTFGTVTAAFFPAERGPDADAQLLAGSGLDTLELVTRIQSSDVSDATLTALRITADRLCSEYPFTSSAQLAVEGHAWLGRITGLLGRRMTLKQHQEVLGLAGMVALLVGCVEYDQGQRAQAEATRRAAFSLGEEAGKADVMAWAQEMLCWFALTQGDLRGVIAAGHAGLRMAPNSSVSVQLAAQQAKAWARLGDRRQTEVALDHGRKVLEALPYPGNVTHHFVVDPAKFDFYGMDCYSFLGEDQQAVLYAEEVLRSSRDLTGEVRQPMRASEANVTLALAAARGDDLDGAVEMGRRAINGDRQSLPSLIMVTGDLGRTLSARFPKEQQTHDFLEELAALRKAG